MYENEIKKLDAMNAFYTKQIAENRKRMNDIIGEKYFLLGKNSVYNDMKKDLTKKGVLS